MIKLAVDGGAVGIVRHVGISGFQDMRRVLKQNFPAGLAERRMMGRTNRFQQGTVDDDIAPGNLADLLQRLRHQKSV